MEGGSAMLTAEGCKQRRARLWAGLKEKPDWILISEPQHLIYFANYYPSPFVFRTQNASALLILGADGSSALIADNLLQPFAEAAHVDKVVAPIWYRSRESAPQREGLLIKTALAEVKAKKGDKIGLEAAVPMGIVQGLKQERPGLRISDVSSVIHNLKRKKDADEMVLMRQAIRAAEAGFDAGIKGIKPGMTELQAFELVSQASMEDAGAQAGIYGDFVSGPRTEEGGGPPSKRVIEKGELFLLDFSVVIHGYRGDFANTFVVDGGRATEKQRELAAFCAESMAVGEKALKAGANCRELDTKARDVFNMRHLGENMTHHVGHGIGLGHPDPPYFVPQSTDTLVAGDVVTIEPGQYIKGVGGMRFERNYLVTETGYENLTNHFIGLEPHA
jgi:Xaa-Pro aminopeptidase